MHQVERSALVPYEPDDMFNLVADVDSYAEFLPWCSHSATQDVGATAGAGNEVKATVEFSLAGFSAAFTTRNTLLRPTRIDMELVDGPFETLAGSWQVAPLGQDGCKLALSLIFEFSNPVKDKLLSPAFAHVCNSLVDAFVDRAHDLYGKR